MHTDNMIRPDLIKRFLRAKGWQKIEHPNHQLLLFQGPKDDRGNPIKIALPVHMDLADSQDMLSKAVNLLSAIQNVPIAGIVTEITNIGYDFLRQRIITPNNESTVSLTMASKIVSSLTEVVKFSACLEEDAQPFFPKSKNIGKKYADKCRFGQTFVGSFGTSLEMPIPPPLDHLEQPPPIERRIMQRIAKGLLIIQQAIQQADIGILVENYRSGFNANIYDVLQKLGETLENCQMEYSFFWSQEYALPKDVAMSPIKFSSGDACLLLESAAKALRTCSESEEALISGKILQLRGDGAGDEEAENLEKSELQEKVIVVYWEAHKIQIRVPLNLSQYKQACDAHRDGRNIQIQGKPEKLGRSFWLTAPHDFLVS